MEDKIRGVEDFPPPPSKTHCLTFLGITSHVHKFLNNFATVATPSKDFIGRKVVFCGEGTRECISSTKIHLTFGTILMHISSDMNSIV